MYICISLSICIYIYTWYAIYTYSIWYIVSLSLYLSLSLSIYIHIRYTFEARSGSEGTLRDAGAGAKSRPSRPAASGSSVSNNTAIVCVCKSIYPSIYLSIYLYLSLSLYIYTYIYIYVCIYNVMSCHAILYYINAGIRHAPIRVPVDKHIPLLSLLLLSLLCLHYYYY